MVDVNYATEGILDAAVAARLIVYCGGALGNPRIAGGKSKLDPQIARYVASARHVPWLILRDLDNDAQCAPDLRVALSSRSYPLLCLRIAVREVEAWLMADREAMSAFLRVRLAQIPSEPEALDDPKQTLVNAARSSRSRGLREALVPRPGVGAVEGPEFSAQMIEFVNNHWRIEIAVAAYPESSLARAVRCVQRLIHEAEKPEYGLA